MLAFHSCDKIPEVGTFVLAHGCNAFDLWMADSISLDLWQGRKLWQKAVIEESCSSNGSQDAERERARVGTSGLLRSSPFIPSRAQPIG